MAKIHPSAIIENGAQIADSAEIGPLCWISSKAKIGDSFWIIEIEASLKKGAKVKITDVKDGVILVAEEYKEK